MSSSITLKVFAGFFQVWADTLIQVNCMDCNNFSVQPQKKKPKLFTMKLNQIYFRFWILLEKILLKNMKKWCVFKFQTRRNVCCFCLTLMMMNMWFLKYPIFSLKKHLSRWKGVFWELKAWGNKDIYFSDEKPHVTWIKIAIDCLTSTRFVGILKQIRELFIK